MNVMQRTMEFLLQATCTRAGELRALLILANCDSSAFADTEAWSALHELLDILLFEAVNSSNLARFAAFTELLQVMTCEADVVTLLSQWLPVLLVGALSCSGTVLHVHICTYTLTVSLQNMSGRRAWYADWCASKHQTDASMRTLLRREGAKVHLNFAYTGPWAATMEVALAMVSSSKKKFMLYKVADRSLVERGDVTLKDAVARSRSATVQRIASISKLRATSLGDLPGINETCA